MPRPFRARLQELDPSYATFDHLGTLQVNLGNFCNLSCTHCHVGASPAGTHLMGRTVMAKIAEILPLLPGVTLDITGGCPELHPLFRDFVTETAGRAPRRLLRSNLAVMSEPGMEWLPRFCAEQELAIFASLPCYLEENVTRQRGSGVYGASIAALQELNRLGYGDSRELNLVYNPGGAVLPGPQRELETAYRSELVERHGIRFTRLYTITNVPVGRFRANLEQSGTSERYLELLAERFNPDTVARLMCRTLVSVDWQGVLYHCDFHQAARLPVVDGSGSSLTVDDLAGLSSRGMGLSFAEHCYSCTAGEGSSCSGALA